MHRTGSYVRFCQARTCSAIWRPKTTSSYRWCGCFATRYYYFRRSDKYVRSEGRAEVIATIQKIKEESNLTVISITHDIDEAANANRILVMRQGQLTNEGTPEKIFLQEKRLLKWAWIYRFLKN